MRPAGEVWRDLVFKQWWTNTTGRTDAAGSHVTRGFLGDYEVEVKAGGDRKVRSAKLERGGTMLRVDLAP